MVEVEWRDGGGGVEGWWRWSGGMVWRVDVAGTLAVVEDTPNRSARRPSVN